MTRTDSNRLIAEYIGESVSCSYTSFNDKTYTSLRAVENITEWDKAFLLYHESWTWIMKVVTKIEHTPLPDNSFPSVLIATNFVRINADIEIEYHCFDNKLQALYQAVIDFINHHNKNK
jgi:hypothetical protein